jgi:hypothetical protein
MDRSNVPSEPSEVVFTPPAAPTPTVVLTQAEIAQFRATFVNELHPAGDAQSVASPTPPVLEVSAELKTCLDFSARLHQATRDIQSLKATWKTYPTNGEDTGIIKSLVSRIDAGLNAAMEGLLHALGAANTANQWRLNDLVGQSPK